MHFSAAFHHNYGNANTNTNTNNRINTKTNIISFATFLCTYRHHTSKKLIDTTIRHSTNVLGSELSYRPTYLSRNINTSA
mmetsp:Transcript_3242/g.6972  ORF Transcript_3242/g.6972 Transcript_3242/m.6972 type:complete len:80 (+) Transcript_3242:1126-1365(+)